MRVAVLHNAVGVASPADEADVLVQVRTVEGALERAGRDVTTVECDLDLERLRRRLLELEPDVVFNLVESLGGHDRLLPLVPALLDVLAIPYTGSPTEALVLATSKLATKRALAAQGLPVPPVLAVLPEDAGGGAQGVAGWSGPVIVKSLFDHGSAALDDAAVLGAPPDLAALERVLAERAPRLGGACFAEAYVAGRELNLSILESSLEPGRLEVLPPAEIVFSDYPSDKPRIVGHRAKWEPSSFEYRHTPRRFDFPPADAPLLDELGRLARTAFTACGLRGYGRVDFRVDESGRPWILEVNANPCLSPDAGLAAAAERSGRHLDALVVAILDGALVRSPRRRAHQPAAV